MWKASFLVSTLLASPLARAQTPTDTSAEFPLQVGASFWTRYEMRDGYDALGRSAGRFLEGDWFVYRARLKLTTRRLALGDSGYGAQVVFSPQADGYWGNQPSTVSTPNLGIYEGFLRLQGPDLRLDVGRFALDYGDALVIGDLRWHQTGRAFDGARLRLGDEAAWGELFFTYLSDGRGVDPSIFGGDVWFTGLYTSFGDLLWDGLSFEPYVLGQVWFDADAPQRADGAVQVTSGLRALQSFGIVDLRLETGLQLGRRRLASGANPEVAAWHADVEVGLKPMPGLRISAEGLVASGDDPSTSTVESWDQLFPTAHKFLGLMDIIGARSNVASGVLHAAYGAGPFAAKLDVHTFLRLERPDGNNYAGTEADLNLVYTLMKGMSVRALYALFIPGSDHFGSEDPAHYVELQYGLGF